MESKMASKKQEEKKFQNVGVFKDDIKLLRKLADKEQRSMARQLSVLIRKAVAEQKAA
jgi:hypothetical protein|tara:strand:+ start:371 stop:544 length:174 start_codon:yes stop_codon:yes gene_type:complete